MALLLITLVRVYYSGFLARLQHSVSICDTLATSVTHLGLSLQNVIK